MTAADLPADWPVRDGHESLADSLRKVYDWAIARFTYVGDPEQFGEPDHWPTRAEVEAQLAHGGRIVGDCDDFAFACHFALQGMGIASQLVLCWTVPGQRPGTYHMVCHCAGYVLDNRAPRLMRRDELERGWPEMNLGPYEWHRMGAGDSWTTVSKD